MSARSEGLEKHRAKVKAGEFKSLNPVEKARKNPKSLRLAINGKCWDCTCGQRSEIKHCPMPDCTLWALRPYQDKAYKMGWKDPREMTSAELEEDYKSNQEK